MCVCLFIYLVFSSECLSRAITSPCIGSIEIEAIPLRPLSYPLWKSDPIDVSDVGPPEEVRTEPVLVLLSQNMALHTL